MAVTDLNDGSQTLMPSSCNVFNPKRLVKVFPQSIDGSGDGGVAT